jgi:glutamate-1-semialdehyde 2,1-aminomutase
VSAIEQAQGERNRAWFERARASVPAGVHSNSRHRSPHPSYFERAQGPYLTDVDGRQVIDLVMGNGAVILGYADPMVTAALHAAVDRGLGAGVESPLSVEAAEAVVATLPQGMQLRFTNTGTEAAMHLSHMARATTGRPSLAKVEGGYDGWYDPLNVSFLPAEAQAGAAEAPATVLGSGGDDARWAADTLVIPHNDADAAEALLRAHAGRVAALFVEPILIDAGFIPGDVEFLRRLRAVTRELGIMLVFDELLTGARIAPGTAAARLGIVPDAFMLGKSIANGMPLAALATTPDWFAAALPGGTSSFVGTFNGHALGLAAVVATQARLADGSVRERLEEATLALEGAFADAARRASLPAVLQGGGGHFQWYFGIERVARYRDLWRCQAAPAAAFWKAMTMAGFAVAPGLAAHQAISLSHVGDPLARVAEAFGPAMAQAAAARPG